LTIVTVDSSFLDELYGAVAGLFCLGFAIGVVMIRKRLGPAGLILWSSKRKRTPLLLHEGKDGTLRFWNTSRSFAGNWRAGKNREMTILPESKSVAQVTKGPPMGLASANGVATLSTRFLWMADRITEYLGHVLPDSKKNYKNNPDAPRMSPDQIAEYIVALRYREYEVRNILAMINRIRGQEVSLEDAVNTMMSERGIEPSDEENKKKITLAIRGAVESQGQSYEEELSKISKEKEVSFKEAGWKLEWENVAVRPKGFGAFFGKPIKRWAVKHVYTAIPVTLLNYIAYMPGATLEDLQTALLEGERAARLERTEDKGEQARWISFGIVCFIILLGIYIVIEQLHLT